MANGSDTGDHPNRRVEATRFRGMPADTTSAEFGAIGGALSSTSEVQERRKQMRAMRAGKLSPEEHAAAQAGLESRKETKRLDQWQKNRSRGKERKEE